MVEWSLLLAVILVLTLVFVRQVRVLQGQAELAAVKSTLGALRTALVIDHLQKSVASEKSFVALKQRNPFELLQHRPMNYFGEMTAAQALAAPTGSWVFDSVCSCVGYLPIYAQWFNIPNGAAMLWYQVSGASGPWELMAKEVYVWQAQELN